jgi:hypothetical protein
MDYTVKSGDTLSAIAARFNTTVGELVKRNPTIKDPDRIRVGQTIDVPPQPQANRVKQAIRSMGTSSPDGICNHCPKRDIKFLVDVGAMNGKVNVWANVNGKGIETLPFMSVYDYSLKNDRYDGRVDVFVGGIGGQIIPNLGDFPPDEDGVCRVFIGSPGQKSTPWNWEPSKTQVEDLSLSPSDESVIILQGDGTSPQDAVEGVHDVNSIGEELLKWLQIQLLGSNLPPLFKDLAELGSISEKRAFLKDVFFGGKFRIEKIKGKWHVIFKGYPGLRTFLTTPIYQVTNPKVNVIQMYVNAATRETTISKAGQAIKSASKGNLISFIIVGFIDVGEFIHAVQKGEKKPGDWFSDLVVDLGMDFAKVMVAGYVSVLAGTAIVAGAAALAISAPVWLVVGGAIVVGVAVGFGLDWLDEKMGLTVGLKSVAKRAQQFIEDAHIPEAVTRSAEHFRRVWSALGLPEAKIIQLRSFIMQAPGSMIRSSPAVTPVLIAAIMLDIMLERKDLRVRIRKTLADTEAKFIEIYEGDAETFEVWSLKTFLGRDIDEMGLGLGHMNIRTVRDLVDNNYLRRESTWGQDYRDVAIKWLTDETRVPVLISARLARISQYWYNASGGTVDISSQPAILASLYSVGLATDRGVHPNPQPNEAGKRVEALMPLARALLNINR